MCKLGVQFLHSNLQNYATSRQIFYLQIIVIKCEIILTLNF